MGECAWCQQRASRAINYGPHPDPIWDCPLQFYLQNDSMCTSTYLKGMFVLWYVTCCWVHLGRRRKKEGEPGMQYQVEKNEEEKTSMSSPRADTLNQTAQWLMSTSELLGFYSDSGDVALPMCMAVLFVALEAVQTETINQRCILLGHIHKWDGHWHWLGEAFGNNI